jgi:hypothetical protein
VIDHNRGGVFGWLDRRAVQRLIGGRLPASATDVRYVCWRPSGDLAYYEAIVRFDCSKDEYLDFVRTRHLTLLSESGPNVHLPASWEPAPAMEAPEWWRPTAETSQDAAGGAVGADGSIVAKWENGHTYVMVTDTGHRHSPQGS